MSRSCPGDVPEMSPEMSRSCPGDVPEMSRRCPGGVPEMSRTSHTFDRRHFFEILRFWGVFSLVLVGFPFFFVIFRIISGFDREIFVFNSFCQVLVCVLINIFQLCLFHRCFASCCLAMFFHWPFGMDWETHLFA